MADLDVIIQPESFRLNPQWPAWAFFPNLRLLLGWGEGLWEVLGDRMAAVRTVFVRGQRPQTPVPPGMNEFVAWREDYDSVRPPMPFYARSVTDVNCMRIASNEVCFHYGGPSICPDAGCHHPLEANQAYRIARLVGADGVVSIVIERRSKTLSPVYQAKMEEFGLVHEHGVGKRTSPKLADERRIRRQRNSNEQAFAQHMSLMKNTYRERRLDELLLDAASRPPDFLVEMARQARYRLELMAQGFKNEMGLPHAMYTKDELLFATAIAIADTEATALAHDYAWTPVLGFDASGLCTL